MCVANAQCRRRAAQRSEGHGCFGCCFGYFRHGCAHACQRGPIRHAKVGGRVGRVFFPVMFPSSHLRGHSESGKLTFSPSAERIVKRGGQEIRIAQEFNDKKKNGLAVYEGNLILTAYMESLGKDYWKDSRCFSRCCTACCWTKASRLGTR